MGLYLDIDLDYFVMPIMKESSANHRPASDEAFRIMEPAGLFSLLSKKEIAFGQKRYLFTNHMQSHLRWWLNRTTDNTVIHIDAHSDLYGHSSRCLNNLKMLGCQNYLWHSIREGLISEIYWVFPDGAVDITDPGLLQTMFAPSQLGHVSLQDDILHVDLRCELPCGQEKKVAYHLLQAADLPVFRTTAEIITVATSPEFIPREADKLIFSVGRFFHLDETVIKNVVNQHTEMKNLP